VLIYCISYSCFKYIQTLKPDYYTDFTNGTSGKLRANTEEQDRRCDFAICLKTLVEAGRYMLQYLLY